MSTLSQTESKLPHGWGFVKLEQIAEINPKDIVLRASEDTEVSFVPMKCVEEETGNVDLSMTRTLTEVRKGYTPFRNGDIIFAKITPCMENGKIAIVDNLRAGIGFGSTEFYVIRPKPEILSRKFIFYYLLQHHFRREAQRSMTGSAGQLRVPTWFIQQTEIPLPPVKEQHLIVTKIEELFTRLDASSEALKKIKTQLKQYRQSLQKHAFEGKLTQEWRRKNYHRIENASGISERIKNRNSANRDFEPISLNETLLPALPKGWTVCTIGDIANRIQYGSSDKASDDSDGIPVIRMGNIQDGNITFDNLKYYPDGWRERDNFILDDGDVLFNRTNSMELVGKTAVYKNRYPKAVFASYLIRLKVDNSVYLPDLLSHFINSVYGRRYIMAVVSQQVGQANVNGTKLSSMPIPVPSLVEQRQIVSELDRRSSIIDNLISTIENEADHAIRLKQSILLSAFKGELVNQNPSDEPATVLLQKLRAHRIDMKQENKYDRVKPKAKVGVEGQKRLI